MKKAHYKFFLTYRIALLVGMLFGPFAIIVNEYNYYCRDYLAGTAGFCDIYRHTFSELILAPFVLYGLIPIVMADAVLSRIPTLYPTGIWFRIGFALLLSGVLFAALFILIQALLIIRRKLTKASSI